VSDALPPSPLKSEGKSETDIANIFSLDASSVSPARGDADPEQ